MTRYSLSITMSIMMLACSSPASPESAPTDTAAPLAAPEDAASSSASTAEPDTEAPQDIDLDQSVGTADASSSQDAAPPLDVAPLDVTVSDLGSATQPDVAIEDSGGPVEDTLIEDIGVAEDTQGAEVDSEGTAPTCEGLLATAEALLASAGAGCGAPDSCVMFEFPICGSFGCFSGAMREDAPEETHTALNDAALSGMNAGCEPFHCGCDFPEGTPVCLQGQCRMCPGDCGDSCEDVEDAIQVAATKLALGCESNEDCAVLPVAPCDLGTAIQCHGLPYRVGVGADLGPVQKLLEGAEEVGCSTFECDCQLTESICSGGTCVPGL